MFKLKSGEPHRNIWTHVFIGHKNLKRFALEIDKKCSLSKSVLYDNLRNSYVHLSLCKICLIYETIHDNFSLRLMI